MAYITIEIPPNATPGEDTLTFQYQGQELEILVPPDASVGDVLQIQVGVNNDEGDAAVCHDDGKVKNGAAAAGRNVNDAINNNGANKSSLLDELGGVDKEKSSKSTSCEQSNINTTTVSLGGTDSSAQLQLIESMDGVQNEGDGTNAMVWPSGLILAQALNSATGIEYIKSLFNAEHTENKDADASMNCLELGSGLGVCGLALAHVLSQNAMEARVFFTDCGETTVKLLSANIQQNKHVFNTSNNLVEVKAAPLTWGETKSTIKYNLILGSDLLYNTNESYEPLVQSFIHHLHPDGRILLAVRWRKPDLEKKFFETATSKGLEFNLWTEVLDAPDFTSRCPCRLSWREYGDCDCEGFKSFFSETTVSTAGNLKSLAEVTETDMELMNDDEYTKFEECQVQLYVGKFRNGKKRGIDDVSC